MPATPLMLASAAFALALLAAAAMGLAMQRGATCTVAAMHELVHERRAWRLLALLEAALWVGAGLQVARALGLQPVLPAAPGIGPWTLVGAVFLALGALVNGACVFGAVARIGTGQWAYLATPLGFYAGCVTASVVMAPAAPAAMGITNVQAGAPPAAGIGVVWLIGAAAALRLGLPVVLQWRRGALRMAPGPHAATAAIGLAFLALLLLAGAWSYTDVLSDLARQMAPAVQGDQARLALAAALLAGALWGGWWTGQWQRHRPTWRAVLRCLAGGWLLGWGSLLVPGGNDSLVLVGLPLLWPHAWASVAVMCGVIAAVLLLQRRRSLPQVQPAGSRQA